MTHEAGIRSAAKTSENLRRIKVAGMSPYPTGCKSLEQREDRDAGTGSRDHGWCKARATPAHHASRVMATVREKH
ncbi:hypothetical protein CH63R_10534 [Colletotrichum higginsianum IMI 349063]|uniref:Uncharacterized protein n=1 Tax=Colletotrichum higginsianum (strain IMI 349063) TaxID=759273 RepID=A0A1B7Y346_COLHI|nr:uncharacterized protein CH63R_10534 [Colletotrichum higginsianum IMI 349063]OBR06414.1 hypothetical protein CH63R_10534 [Colletotrichum higginsianum IMI 349063]